MRGSATNWSSARVTISGLDGRVPRSATELRRALLDERREPLGGVVGRGGCRDRVALARQVRLQRLLEARVQESLRRCNRAARPGHELRGECGSLVAHIVVA